MTITGHPIKSSPTHIFFYFYHTFIRLNTPVNHKTVSQHTHENIRTHGPEIWIRQIRKLCSKLSFSNVFLFTELWLLKVPH